MKFNSNSVRKILTAHVFLVLVFLFFWSTFDLPWAVTYIFDMLLCVEFVWVLPGIQPVLRRTKAFRLIPFFAVYALYLLLTQLVNFVSPVLAVMAFRRIFRFYMFFFACAVMMTEDRIDRILNMLTKLQMLNLALTLYQFFVQDLSQDYLGGIFGVEKGANAYSNVFLCIICTYVIVQYLAKQTNVWSLILTIGSALLIAVLAELKIFFIEIAVIVLAAILFSHPSTRTVRIILFSAGGVVVALMLFAKLFPEHMAILMDWALFTEYTTESIYGYEIGRLSAFPEINRLFFKDSILNNLFGFGFGNCESGSAFFEHYGKYTYTWFTHQVMFLETGYVGIFLYAFFFVMIFAYAQKSRKVNPEKDHYYTFTQIICILCGIWMIYDSSLRVELAYVIFFVLAIPIAIRNNWAKSLQQGRRQTI